LKSLDSGEVYLRDAVEGGETPEEALEREELRRRVAEALERLEAVHGPFVRQAVERVLMDGTPAELAAEEEGVSLEALSS
jgi:DNA-directed RNA polymerase specialized sigma24 family protein